MAHRGNVILKWLGLLGLLAVLVIGDQIRIHRPAHKFRLTMNVETPAGLKTASGVMSVHPDRGYTQGNSTRTKGDAIVLDIGGGTNLVALLAHLDEGKLDLDGIHYVALRAFRAAGMNVPFSRLSGVTGSAPVVAPLVPILVTFSDPNNPSTARVVDPANLAATLGPGVSWRGMTVEIVPNGLWPIDFGGFLGTPVTRNIADRLPWLDRPDGAASAIAATGLPVGAMFDAKAAFTRK